jgi:hypothetical protein
MVPRAGAEDEPCARAGDSLCAGGLCAGASVVPAGGALVWLEPAAGAWPVFAAG